MNTVDDALGHALAQSAPSRAYLADSEVRRAVEAIDVEPRAARRTMRAWFPVAFAGAALLTTAGAVVSAAVVPSVWGEDTGFDEQASFAMGDDYGRCELAIVTQYLGEPLSDAPRTLDGTEAGIPEDFVDLAGGGGDENDPGLDRSGMTEAEFSAVRDWIAAQDWSEEQEIALQHPQPIAHTVTTDFQGRPVDPTVAADFARAEGAGYALVDIVHAQLAEEGLNANGSAGIGFWLRCDIDG